jgi:hypothetical protein
MRVVANTPIIHSGSFFQYVELVSNTGAMRYQLVQNSLDQEAERHENGASRDAHDEFFPPRKVDDYDDEENDTFDVDDDEDEYNEESDSNGKAIAVPQFQIFFRILFYCLI